jgi:hypothetical protein
MNTDKSKLSKEKVLFTLAAQLGLLGLSEKLTEEDPKNRPSTKIKVRDQDAKIKPFLLLT